LPTWLTISAFQMLLICAGESNSTVQPENPDVPAVTMTVATKPDPQLSLTTYFTDESTGVGVVPPSSSVMVPVAVPSAMVAPVGLDSGTGGASSDSASCSPRISTCRVIDMTPDANSMTPEAAV